MRFLAPYFYFSILLFLFFGLVDPSSPLFVYEVRLGKVSGNMEMQEKLTYLLGRGYRTYS